MRSQDGSVPAITEHDEPVAIIVLNGSVPAVTQGNGSVPAVILCLRQTDL